MPQGHYASRRKAEIRSEVREQRRAEKAAQPKPQRKKRDKRVQWPNPETLKVRNEWAEARKQRETDRQNRRIAEQELARERKAASDAILYAPLNDGTQVDLAAMERERRRIRGAMHKTNGGHW